MQESYKLLIGIDWGNFAHQVCAIDPDRRIVGERSFEHSGVGIKELTDWLIELAYGEPATAGVAIETPRGAVVETLVERGFHVFAVNPKQLDRFRDRHTVAGAKDDRRDAFVLADSLRTDEPCFRRLKLDDPVTIQLREFARLEWKLTVDRVRFANRLRDQLLRYYPQALTLSPAADEPWFWALLELAPTPEAARSLRPARVKKLLSKHRIRRVGAEDVLGELRKPAVWLAPGTVEAAAAHVGLLLPQLRLTHSQRQECATRIEKLFEQLSPAEGVEGEKCEHRDVDILRSLPGVGRFVAATMLAEASQPLGERDYHTLRGQAGVAPVTRQSGKRLTVVMRRGCNGRLREAMYHWTRVSCQRDPRARRLYDELRARGHRHGRALRGVADRQLRVLMAMLRDRSLYDPSRRQVEVEVVS